MSKFNSRKKIAMLLLCSTMLPSFHISKVIGMEKKEKEDILGAYLRRARESINDLHSPLFLQQLGDCAVLILRSLYNNDYTSKNEVVFNELKHKIIELKTLKHGAGACGRNVKSLDDVIDKIDQMLTLIDVDKTVNKISLILTGPNNPKDCENTLISSATKIYGIIQYAHFNDEILQKAKKITNSLKSIANINEFTNLRQYIDTKLNL